ncbi:MAG: type II toxin-antitoxin system RelE/ParE family toxin [Magnetococcales bacterium]|nr:type II toxin-antitoxin system RelE/ParE family toxin [Magnetococcales bacterium]
MPRILFMSRALRDLQDAVLFISMDQPRNAVAWESMIHERIEKLATFPWIGTTVTLTGHIMRRFPIDRYIIYYQIISDGIKIVRILHAARDLRTIRY